MSAPTDKYCDDFARLGLPWTSHEFPFLLELVNSAHNIPGELALALGGSFASSSNSPYSDVDMFLYVGEGDAYSHAAHLRSSLRADPSVITACPIQHYDSFGYRCSWTLFGQPASLVELFVSSALDLRETAMARWNRLLIDRSPAYRSHLFVCGALSQDLSEDTLDLVLHDLVAGAQRIRKAINCGSFIQGANRLYKFRMATLPVLNFHSTGVLQHPLVGEKYLQCLAPGIRDVIERTYSLDSLEDVTRHFRTLTDLLQPGILALFRSGYLSERQAKLITERLRHYALLS